MPASATDLSDVLIGCAIADDAHLQESSRRICRWLIRFFGADVVSLYQLVPTANGAMVGFLTKLGHAVSHEPDGNKLSDEIQLSMRILEREPRDRWNSISYRALHSLELEVVRDWDGRSGLAGIWELGPDNPIAARGRTGVAAPIKVFGRAWGVIEMAGFTPYQFDHIDPIWLKEVSALVGERFHNVGMLAQISSLNHAILWKRGGDAPSGSYSDLMDTICERVARVFLADGAALWLEDDLWPGQFELQGLFGVIDDPYRREFASDRPDGWMPPVFGRDDQDSLSIRAINEATLQRQIETEGPTAPSVTSSSATQQVIQEVISLPPEASKRGTARLAYHQRQWDSHVRHHAVIPLLAPGEDREEQVAIGTIVLFTKELGSVRLPEDRSPGAIPGYSNSWIPLIEFAGSQVAMLVRTLRLETLRQNQIELMLSHEVVSKTNRILDQFSYLDRNVLQKLFNFDSDRLRSLDLDPALLARSKMASDRVRIEAEMLTSSLQSMREHGFELPRQPNLRMRSGRDAPAKLFDLLRDAFNSRHGLVRTRNLPNPIFTGGALNHHLRFQDFSRSDIAKILENLADNALKYCAPERAIRVNADLVAETLEISISSAGSQFTMEERTKLFKSGFRGAAARSSRQSGTGNGLYIARTLAQQIGADLLYEETPGQRWSFEHSNPVWHNFRLLISATEVIRDGR